MSNQNGIPQNWHWSTMTEVCEKIQDGTHFSPGQDKQLSQGQYPYVTAKNVRPSGLDLSNLTYLEENEHRQIYNRCDPQTGDVLLVKDGVNTGDAAINTIEGEISLLSSVSMLRPRKQILAARFLRYYILSPQGYRSLTGQMTGTAIKRIILRKIRETPVPIAPINEQLRIVDKIDELFSDLDAGVAALQRAKANLKRYRTAVLKAAVEGKLTEAWRAKHPKTEPASKLLERILTERRQKWEADQLAKFAAAGKQPAKNWQEKYVEPSLPDTNGLPELPKGWCWASVDQLSEVQGGIQKQPKRAPRQNCFPFLRVANVHRNRLELEEIHQVELFGDELDRLRLKIDDLLVVEGNGSKTEIGRSAIWNNEIKNCVHQNHIIRVRFLAGSSRYLNAYWNSPSGNGRVMEQAASTSGLYTLSVTKVCALPVPLAPIQEQNQIVVEVEEKLSQIDAAEAAITRDLLRATRLRQSILKQAFEGKLVPQDPSDEPAGVILDRLRGNASDATDSTIHQKATRTRGKRFTSRSSRKEQVHDSR